MPPPLLFFCHTNPQFGAFVGISAYKRLEIQNKYNPGKVLEEYVLKIPASLRPEEYFLITALVMVNCIKWVIFGRLTPNEIQSLRDKVTYTIWEFCFGFMIFYCKCFALDFTLIQSELFKFAGLFLCVLLLKGFHHLSAERVSSIFPSSRYTHYATSRQIKYMGLRFALGLCLLNFIHGLLLVRFIHEVSQRYNATFVSKLSRPISVPAPVSVSKTSTIYIEDNILLAIFGFEILYMFPLIVLTTIKFAVNFYEYLRFESQLSAHFGEEDEEGEEDNYDQIIWKENKLKIIYVSQFLVNLLRFLMIALFSLIFLYVYTFPFHILPSSYSSFRILIDNTRCLVNFKKKQFALKKLQIPSVPGDSVQCIICYDMMKINTEVRQLRCNHRFHYSCLKNWIEYSSSCPICREKI
ncbi:uncharacterized protein CANTADRAFT_21254 [Suhomyces tanzawaensis NRRL Y-17324]|uniref:RING-type domain-containing protein n=1 Tax=Suhomyces tanzawaensis NRRL Y-17324 TaxID=984487 RepID=A0A1E4SKM2_9ASCO|nr:uncharacterized protein CANTADRAFT_21254 [Suhomyces tanzawaensis NRRL Y-17324]ODV79987.1 hypothetical protein CANTADRAFT_21254 [Suhomyces tanzawaensis NRRL Y-17324]